MSQSKTFNTPFLLAIICIYLSYFLHGISVITLAQNMTSLAEKFSTDNAGIAYLISGIGLGRLVSILFFGVLSDKFGRRAIILLGAILYILFFFGIPASPNLMIAFILAVCVGVANSALDTGGYPALMECFLKPLAQPLSGESYGLVWADDLPHRRQHHAAQPYLVRLCGHYPGCVVCRHYLDAAKKSLPLARWWMLASRKICHR